MQTYPRQALGEPDVKHMLGELNYPFIGAMCKNLQLELVTTLP